MLRKQLVFTRFGFSLAVSLSGIVHPANLALLHPVISQAMVEQELILYVYAESYAENSFQLNACTVGAFEALRNQAFEIGIWIPKIRGGSRKITPVCDVEMKTV
jgi:hypothetical protein